MTALPGTHRACQRCQHRVNGPVDSSAPMLTSGNACEKAGCQRGVLTAVQGF